MSLFRSFERGMAWGVGRELARSAMRPTHLTTAQRKVLAAWEERKAQLALGYVTDKTALAYMGDRVDFADTSKGAAVVVQGTIIELGHGERIKVRLPLAKGGHTDKWAERLYLDLLPHTAGWRAPALNAKSVVLLKSPEWFAR